MEPNKFGIALSSRLAVDVTGNSPENGATSKGKPGVLGKNAVVALLALGGLFALTESMMNPNRARARELMARGYPPRSLPQGRAPTPCPVVLPKLARVQVVAQRRNAIPYISKRTTLVVASLLLLAAGVAAWSYYSPSELPQSAPSSDGLL